VDYGDLLGVPSVLVTHTYYITVMECYTAMFYSCAMIRYDTIEYFNVDSKAECDQFNLAHVARNKKKCKKKQKLKQTKRQCPLSSVRAQDP